MDFSIAVPQEHHMRITGSAVALATAATLALLAPLNAAAQSYNINFDDLGGTAANFDVISGTDGTQGNSTVTNGQFTVFGDADQLAGMCYRNTGYGSLQQVAYGCGTTPAVGQFSFQVAAGSTIFTRVAARSSPRPRLRPTSRSAGAPHLMPHRCGATGRVCSASSDGLLADSEGVNHCTRGCGCRSSGGPIRGCETRVSCTTPLHSPVFDTLGEAGTGARVPIGHAP
jgi:hypothetical protein